MSRPVLRREEVRRVRTLVRQPGWERRLVAWAESVAGAAFEWGVVDCAQLAIGAIEAMTLTRIGADVRPYSSRFGALRAMVDSGGVIATLSRIGLRDVDVQYAQQGDIIVAPPWDGNALEDASILVSGQLLAVVEDGAVHWTEGWNAGAVAMRV